LATFNKKKINSDSLYAFNQNKNHVRKYMKLG